MHDGNDDDYNLIDVDKAPSSSSSSYPLSSSPCSFPSMSSSSPCLILFIFPSHHLSLFRLLLVFILLFFFFVPFFLFLLLFLCFLIFPVSLSSMFAFLLHFPFLLLDHLLSVSPSFPFSSHFAIFFIHVLFHIPFSCSLSCSFSFFPLSAPLFPATPFPSFPFVLTLHLLTFSLSSSSFCISPPFPSFLLFLFSSSSCFYTSYLSILFLILVFPLPLLLPFFSSFYFLPSNSLSSFLSSFPPLVILLLVLLISFLILSLPFLIPLPWFGRSAH